MSDTTTQPRSQIRSYGFSSVREEYKHTDVGVIPADWDCDRLGDLATRVGSGITPTGGERVYVTEGRPFLRSQNVGWGVLNLDDLAFITDEIHASFAGSQIKEGDVLLNITGASIGRSAVADTTVARGNVNQHVCEIRPNPKRLDSHFLNGYLLSAAGQKQIDSFQAGGNRQGLNYGQIRSFLVPCPPLREQRAIAEALSDVDEWLAALNKLIDKKRALKLAAMQQLLTGETRLPGFSEAWETKQLQHIVDCLDNFRIPLNESQRANMLGPYPYCGANGVLDYVNDFVIDDDVILIAEDGGYFDEYFHRPIAYRMSGKIWVNNHAHVIKSKPEYNQGFVFFSLVHKNILPYLASGTRAKLNRSEMNKIEVHLPVDLAEQQAIAEILSDMDAEIAALERRRDKARAIKYGMMQVLLPGRVRLVEPESASEPEARTVTSYREGVEA